MENSSLPVDVKILDIEYCSTTEILIDILSEYDMIQTIDKSLLTVAFLAILFDSKRLILANANTLQKVAIILQAIGGTLEDYLRVLDFEKDTDERIALIKSAQRNKLIIIKKKYLVSLSFVSSYESSSARSMIYLGSDIAAVLNMSKLPEVRISFRANKLFHEETKIHLGELAQEMAKKFSGTGSGHPTASGCNLLIERKSKDDIKAKVYGFILDYLEKQIT
jgi:nanoRNase/pAp phosphatase (c-di-AMP/oligoRNAs hydrolase)